jgi:hypothetical protein
MAPAIILIQRDSIYPRRLEGDPGSWRNNAATEAFIIESWSQGFFVGALLIMACITIANMKAGIFLHKLILLEVRQKCQLCFQRLIRVSALPGYVTWDILLHEL